MEPKISTYDMCLKINNYIKDNISYSKNVKEAFANLDKLSSFLKPFYKFLRVDINKRIIEENKAIASALKLIIDNNIEKIKVNGLDSLTKDDNTLFLLEIYINSNRKYDELFKIIMENIYHKLNANIKEIKYNDDITISYLNNLNYPLLNEFEQRNLLYALKRNDNRAKEYLITRNLRLVVSIAKKYVGHGIELLDLIEEGNLSLVEAVSALDFNQSLYPTTYFYRRVERSIKRAISNKSKIVRVPEYLYTKMNKYNQAKLELEQIKGSDVTIHEICAFLNWDYRLTTLIFYLNRPIISINEPLDSQYDSLVIADTIKDESKDLFLKAEDNILIQKLNEDLTSILTEREIKILYLFFGCASKPMSYREIAKVLNISYMTVSNDYHKSLEKLRKYLKADDQNIKIKTKK